jgi:hypothetical protein
VRDGMEVLASCGSDSMLWLEGGMESMFWLVREAE